MSKEITGFAKNAIGFSKSPLGIIALFIVLVYGFATIAASFGNNFKEHLTPLVLFIVLFPVLVFFGFLWLVSKHYDKIYGPSDFKNEENFFKMKMYSVASLAIASAKQTDNTISNEIKTQQLNSLVELVSKIDLSKHKRDLNNRPRILWVDDRPENNVYERKAFEAQGIEISIALSTNEAIERLLSNNFSAIISDMGRKEGAEEGYVLLDKVRDSGNSIPYFIYAGSNSLEHKRMALERGAQGSTNDARELYEMIFKIVFK
nr:response regulator [uncultured Draconibacterium sp.]